jgi:hypothetical protein
LLFPVATPTTITRSPCESPARTVLHVVGG